MASTGLDWRGLVVWGVSVLYVVYQFVLQMSAGVFAADLQVSLAATAGGVGFVTALFALTYAVMQIPAGILVEERSPRLLMTAGLSTCAVATWLFAAATDVWVAGFARALMGVGASFGFVGTAVIVTRWIPAQHFALFIGMTEALGMLGTALIDDLLAALLERFAWRPIVAASGGVGVLLAFLLFAVVRDRPSNATTEQVDDPRLPTRLLPALRLLLGDGPVWLVGCYYALALGAVLGFAGLWNVPFQAAFGIGLVEAARANSLIFVGMAVGCPVAGWLSDRIGRRRPVVLASLVGHAAVLATILYTPLLPAAAVYALRFALGFLAAGNVLAFAMAAERAPSHLRGAAIGAVNTFGFLGVTAAQVVPGLLLRTTNPDAPQYTAVLSVLLVGLAVGGLLVWALKEAPTRTRGQ